MEGWRYIFGFIAILALDMQARNHYELHHQSEAVIASFILQLVIYAALFTSYLMDD